MKIHFAAVLLLFIVMSSLGMAVSLKGGQPFIKTNTIGDFQKVCLDSLKRLPGNVSKTALDVACSRAKVLEGCNSVEGHPIYHFQPKSKQTSNQNRILVIGVMHGDEAEGGSVARRWMERLTRLQSRNKWRIIPILNPDGLKMKTRVNANGVDINRNFPSADWDALAHKYWISKKNKDPRRNPGPSASSEPETVCAVRHIEDFAPHFIVAIHTPYGVLDFDGPKVKAPMFPGIPWVSLGTFPGSLGRFMWKGKGVPVLTVELKGAKLLEQIDQMDLLQDVAGTLAIKVKKTKKKLKNSL